MKIRTQIFLSFLVLISLGFYFFVDWALDDIKPHYRESTEDSLADTAIVLGALAGESAKAGNLDVNSFRTAFKDVYSRKISAKIYDFVKSNVDLRIYITNKVGTVVFDSDNGRDEGKSYADWRDVKLTLQGEYGARTSRDDPKIPDQSILYVAAPIFSQGEIIGVLSVGKPTVNANLLISSAEKKITEASLIVFTIVVILGLLLSHQLTNPIERLIEYAQAVRDGRRVSMPKLGKNELGKLAQAYEEMRQSIEGKKYIEKYVQTLTHEIKSPLSGIRAAAELLQGNMPAEEQKRFHSNILNESNRIQELIEKMLLLSSLQAKQQLDEAVNFSTQELIIELKRIFESQAREKNINLQIDSAEEIESIKGDRFLIKQALLNLIQNAIDFSPNGSHVSCNFKTTTNTVEISVEDSGSGIPDYALPRIFETFYSLKRPNSGRKSTGLGLSLVKEVAELHNGNIEISNKKSGGVRAVLSLPK